MDYPMHASLGKHFLKTEEKAHSTNGEITSYRVVYSRVLSQHTDHKYLVNR